MALSAAMAALAVVCCLLYGQAVRGAVERERSEALERYGGEVVPVVVAMGDLAAGEPVGARNVTVRDWVADLVPEGAFTSLSDVEGRTVSVPVAAGVPLTSLNFRDDARAAEVPAGRVAVAVSAPDRAGMPPGVAEGTRLAAYEVTQDGVRLLSQGCVVIGVPAEGAQGASATVGLAVEPGDVSAVLGAAARGTLRLAVPADDVDGLSLGPVAAPDEVAPVGGEADGSAPAGETGGTSVGWEGDGEAPSTVDGAGEAA